MIGKWIICNVSYEQRQAFSQAQEAWQESIECEGYYGQIGGWDVTTSQALILALWKNQESVERFMNSHHDAILSKNNQQETYQRSSVAYLKKIIDIPAYHNKPIEFKPGIRFIRVADCCVFSDQEEFFRKVQKNIWNPGMAACPGMLGGYLWQYTQEPHRYLVTSFWENEKSHHDYVEQALPALKNQANVKKSVRDLQGYQVRVEKSWIVWGN